MSQELPGAPGDVVVLHRFSRTALRHLVPAERLHLEDFGW